MQTNQKQAIEWVNVEEEIYQALVSEFKDDLTDWEAEIERDTLTTDLCLRRCYLHEDLTSYETGSTHSR